MRSGTAGGRAVVVGRPRRVRKSLSAPCTAATVAAGIVAGSVGGRSSFGMKRFTPNGRSVAARTAADRVPDLIGRQVQARDDPQAAGLRHFGHEVRAGDASHPRLHDRMLDTQQVAERGPQGHGVNSSSARSRSLTRCTLSPCGLGVRGTSATKRTCRGIL